MAGSLVRINRWLTPFSWIYGFIVWVRNQLFELGILKSRSFDTPVIAVGNITVGGAGKTPHVEYLIRLLHDKVKVAVLSRGYKRKTHGFLLADESTTVTDIGDEPYQMWKKYPDIFVAVDKNRCEGIDFLTDDGMAKGTDVVLLDDAFQHRYVKPGVNILLVDYHRQLNDDKLLPAGRLREPKDGKARADMVIITKCPKDLKAIDYRVLTKTMSLYPYQDLFFTSLEYGQLYQVFGSQKAHLDTLKDKNVLLLTGIASPNQMLMDLNPLCHSVTPLSYPDHHRFKSKDADKINHIFETMESPKIIVTTEKDATRLECLDGLSQEVRDHIFALPIEVKFMLGQEEMFNQKIISYVHKNSRNSILAKGKDDHKSKNSNHTGNGSRTINFRYN